MVTDTQHYQLLQGVEPAMEWLLTRTEDASLEEPPSSDDEEEEAPKDETPAVSFCSTVENKFNNLKMFHCHNHC